MSRHRLVEITMYGLFLLILIILICYTLDRRVNGTPAPLSKRKKVIAQESMSGNYILDYNNTKWNVTLTSDGLYEAKLNSSVWQGRWELVRPKVIRVTEAPVGIEPYLTWTAKEIYQSNLLLDYKE